VTTDRLWYLIAIDGMNSKKQSASDLESELLRLNTLVRQRRAQLARLETCPHKDCECRALWNRTVEKHLATQVRKIRKGVSSTNGTQVRKNSTRKTTRARK